MATSTSVTPQQVDRCRWALRVTGIAIIGFFAVAVPLALAGSVDHHSLAGRLLMWGPGGAEYVVMIGALNIALGIGMVRASVDPPGHAQAVDLVILIHTAHIAAMMLMALAMSGHRAHLLGDVLIGVVPAVVLIATWLPVRPAGLAGTVSPA